MLEAQRLISRQELRTILAQKEIGFIVCIYASGTIV